MDMSEWVLPQDEEDSPPNLPQCLLPILIYPTPMCPFCWASLREEPEFDVCQPVYTEYCLQGRSIFDLK